MICVVLSFCGMADCEHLDERSCALEMNVCAAVSGSVVRAD